MSPFRFSDESAYRAFLSHGFVGDSTSYATFVAKPLRPRVDFFKAFGDSFFLTGLDNYGTRLTDSGAV